MDFRLKFIIVPGRRESGARVRQEKTERGEGTEEEEKCVWKYYSLFILALCTWSVGRQAMPEHMRQRSLRRSGSSDKIKTEIICSFIALCRQKLRVYLPAPINLMAGKCTRRYPREKTKSENGKLEAEKARR